MRKRGRHLVQYFCRCNAIQQNGDTPSYLDYVKETDHRFELKTTDCSKVFSLLSKLCKSKATALDKISARIQECADLVASTLCAILNRSIVSGVFPAEWKSAKVISLFKQGERSDLQWLKWLSAQRIGKEIRASSYFFTRRPANVVSEACFTVMTGDRHAKRAAMDFSMIIFAQTPSWLVWILTIMPVWLYFSSFLFFSVLFLNSELYILYEC